MRGFASVCRQPGAGRSSDYHVAKVRGFCACGYRDWKEPRGMTFFALRCIITLHYVRVAQLVAQTQGI